MLHKLNASRLIFWLLIVFFQPISLTAQEQEQPNIIVFLVDDMGWQDTSVPFWDSITPANKKFQTPNMERLASKGMKFTNAYANSICTPSRVSMMTGMNTARHKVTNWTMYPDEKVDPKDSILEVPNWNNGGISPIRGVPNTKHATTLFQILNKQGYYTIHSGKAHFGAVGTPGADPEHLGAQVNIAGSAAGNPASYLGEEQYGNKSNTNKVRAIKGLKEYWDTPTFLSKAITLEALKAMDSAQEKNKPFFLHMSHYAVHLPYDPDERYFDHYKEKGLPDSEAAYAALVEGMDRSLGRIMDYLEEKGLDQNTAILFISDNGGLSHPPRTGDMDTQNYPLRYGKGSLYEGGIREPMLVYWPSVTEENSTSHLPVSIWDYFPTVLDIAGVEDYKTIQKVDGKSFVPNLKNKDEGDFERSLLWHFPNKWGGDEGIPGYSWTSALRKGDWKLIYLQKEEELKLYNLKDDLKEKHNLAHKKPEQLKEMAELMTKKLKDADAQRPTKKATGEKIAWPSDVLQK